MAFKLTTTLHRNAFAVLDCSDFMYIGNLILLFLNLPLIPYIARLLIVPRSLLAPLILMFSVAGVYLVSFNSSDLVILAGITFTALILRWGGYPMARHFCWDLSLVACLKITFAGLLCSAMASSLSSWSGLPLLSCLV